MTINKRLKGFVSIFSTTKTISLTATILLIIGLIITIYIGGCEFVSHAKNKAFDLVQVGDMESTVVGLFGATPIVREKPGVLFFRYATHPCSSPCTERLWFENRFSLDTEAWSVEMDQNGRVIKKSRWVSP